MPPSPASPRRPRPGARGYSLIRARQDGVDTDGQSRLRLAAHADRLGQNQTPSTSRRSCGPSRNSALPYRRIDAGMQFGVNDTPEYKAMNPTGLIPTIDDDGYVLWESNVIVRYLAAKHAPRHPLSRRSRGALPCRALDGLAGDRVQPGDHAGLPRPASARRRRRRDPALHRGGAREGRGLPRHPRRPPRRADLHDRRRPSPSPTSRSARASTAGTSCRSSATAAPPCRALAWRGCAGVPASRARRSCR